MKKVLYSFLVLVCVFMLTGCSVKSKTFTADGLKITLLSDFEEYESASWNMYLENDDLAFMCNQFEKTTKIENGDLSMFTLEQYALYLMSTSNISTSLYQVDGFNGKFYYCYYNTYYDKDNPVYGYMLVVMEGEDHFYAMNFSCDYEKFQDMKKVMLQYAMTIEVE